MSGSVRGCGTRVRGGIYASCPLSPTGRPIEDFLVDPPRVMDEEERQKLGVRPIGVALIELGGVTHIIDWVGSQHYPEVAGFVEETRRLGLSRRLPRTLDFFRLSPKSTIILLHARAYIDNHQDYYLAAGWMCPKDLDDHSPLLGGRANAIPSEMCAGLYWEDLDRPLFPDPARGEEDRTCDVLMPSFTYTARCRPKSIEPHYQVAIFMRLPLDHLEVIRDFKAGEHEPALEAAQKAGINGLRVQLEDG